MYYTCAYLILSYYYKLILTFAWMFHDMVIVCTDAVKCLITSMTHWVTILHILDIVRLQIYMVYVMNDNIAQ